MKSSISTSAAIRSWRSTTRRSRSSATWFTTGRSSCFPWRSQRRPARGSGLGSRPLVHAAEGILDRRSRRRPPGDEEAGGAYRGSTATARRSASATTPSTSADATGSTATRSSSSWPDAASARPAADNRSSSAISACSSNSAPTCARSRRRCPMPARRQSRQAACRREEGIGIHWQRLRHPAGAAFRLSGCPYRTLQVQTRE